jgi:hypothetical protein
VQPHDFAVSGAFGSLHMRRTLASAESPENPTDKLHSDFCPDAALGFPRLLSSLEFVGLL